nr:DNA polymerase [Chloroflexota bacterium]
MIADSEQQIIAADAPGGDSSLFGVDETPGIVSVLATYAGKARAWRRLADGTTQANNDAYNPWLLVPDLALLGDLPLERLVPSNRFPTLPHGRQAGYRELDGDGHYKYLVLARDFGVLERAILRSQNRDRLWDLRDNVYYRPPVEQYLVQTGRAYYKGMLWEDVRRMQFDLETTALNPHDGEIFMISVRDSSGWEQVLDATEHDGEGG